MSHLSNNPTPSVRLLLAARLGIVLGISLALWLGLGGSLAAASRLAGSANGLAGPAGLSPQALACSSAVTVTNANDSGDGSLRQAIADVCGGGRITFSSSYTIYLLTTLEISKGLTIDGETHTVAVSGDSGGDGIPNVQVFSINTNAGVTLIHLGVVSGTADYGGGIDIHNLCRLTVISSTLGGNSARYFGGGIDNWGTLTLQNSTLISNSALSGGGIANNGTVIVQNSVFISNSAELGGGIRSDVTLTVNNSTFAGNSASYGGAGIYNWGVLTVTNSTLAGNSADYSGGGIYSDSSSGSGKLTVTNTTLISNSASRYGGGIYNNRTALAVQNSTLAGNSAKDGGGLYNDRYSAMLTVQNSTLAGNLASQNGAGAYNRSALTVTNSTLSGNSAGSIGGGIYNENALTVTNSTLAGNSADYFAGGGIANGGNMNLSNTLIARSPLGGDCQNWSALGAGDHNLIEDTGSEACNLTNGVNGNIVGVDPQIGDLADNGGGTQTHALLRGSPAIDAGAACPDADQRGVPRPQGAACDIGAFERAASDEWDSYLPLIQRP